MRAHEERLEKAAGISSVDLICHRDTWQWIRTNVRLVNEPGSPPADVTMLQVPISGPNLTAMLVATWFKQSAPGTYMVDRALAGRIYDTVAEVVDAVDPMATDGTPLPNIVIDAKIAAPSNADFDEDHDPD